MIRTSHSQASVKFSFPLGKFLNFSFKGVCFTKRVKLSYEIFFHLNSCPSELNHSLVLSIF